MWSYRKNKKERDVELQDSVNRLGMPDVHMVASASRDIRTTAEVDG